MSTFKITERFVSRLLAGVLAVLAAASAVMAAPSNVDFPCPHAGNDATIEARYRALLDEVGPLNAAIDEFYARCQKVVAGSAADAQCRKDKTEIDTRWQAYDDRVAAYEAERRRARENAAGGENAIRVAALDVKIAQTRSKIEATVTQIRNLHNGMKEWEAMTESARLQVRTQAWSALYDVFFEGAVSVVKERGLAQVALDQTQVRALHNRILPFIVPKGVLLPQAQIDKLLYWNAFASNQGVRIGMRLDKTRTQLTTLSALKEANEMFERMDVTDAWLGKEADRISVQKKSAATLKLFVKNPAHKLIITNFETGFSFGYLFTARHLAIQTVDALDAASAKSLKAIDSLSALYKKQIDERASLRPKLPMNESAMCR